MSHEPLRFEFSLKPDGQWSWDGRSSFSPINGKLQVAWDSTSVAALKRCPRYYQYSILEGWRSKHALNLHLRFGLLYHRALEVYDHKKFEGMDHEEAMVACLIDLAHGCMDEQENGTFVLWDPNENLDEDKAAKNNKTIYNLFRSVVWYLERFGKHDPIETVRLKNGKPAVELSFRFDAGFSSKITGEPYLLSGHLDRLGTFAGQIHVVDRKTSSSTLGRYYFDQFHPNTQMTQYTLAGKVVLESPVAGVIIDGVQIARGFSAFERGITKRTDAQLEEWLADLRYWIGQNEVFVLQNHWPMNDTSCNDYGGCTFRKICSKDPRVRQQYLESDFKIEKWDPLKVRGDI